MIKVSATVKVGAHGKNAGWWKVRDAIASGAEFTNSNGSFHGEIVDVSSTRAWPATGQLPYSYVQWFKMHRDRIDYVIYSYGTPIAWHVRATEGENAIWIMPVARYSVTTSRHQGQAHVAIAEQPSSSPYGGEVVRIGE